jgi:hypothetical protein
MERSKSVIPFWSGLFYGVSKRARLYWSPLQLRSKNKKAKEKAKIRVGEGTKAYDIPSEKNYFEKNFLSLFSLFLTFKEEQSILLSIHQSIRLVPRSHLIYRVQLAHSANDMRISPSIIKTNSL